MVGAEFSWNQQEKQPEADETQFLKITCSSLTLLNFTSLKIETGKFISLKNTIPQLLH